MSYQDVDADIIDYGMIRFPNGQAEIRGPLPRNFEQGGYICAIGAAQTFGRFTKKPFLSLVGEALGVETLNLGLAGGGPRHFAARPRMIEAANRASLIILQVMSGRSVSNSYFENTSAGSLRPWNSPPGRAARHAEIEYSELLEREGEAFIKGLIAETRQNYLSDYDALLAKLTAPVLLFWFSTRTPHYEEFYKATGPQAAGGFLGAFPQLVNAPTLDALRKKTAYFASCVSKRGLPQPLFHKVTGEVVDLGIAPRYPGHNNYYPSPEMHQDAAEILVPAVRDILSPSSPAA